MDFNFSDDQTELRRMVSEFCSRHCTEDSARALDEERHLRESFLGLYAGGTAEIQRNLIAEQLLR